MENLIAAPKGLLNTIMQTFQKELLSEGHFSAFLKSCETCHNNNIMSTKKYGLMKPTYLSTKTLHKVIIDFIDPIAPSNECKHILTVTDSTTRYCWVFLCKNSTAHMVAKNLLYKHG